jgi:hypothetical protein
LAQEFRLSAVAGKKYQKKNILFAKQLRIL